jgi:hypothetical protein
MDEPVKSDVSVAIVLEELDAVCAPSVVRNEGEVSFDETGTWLALREDS